MFHIVIPARIKSTRLPNKPLQEIGGIPMVLHVYQRALEANAASVVVATDDEQIKRICEAAGATVFISDIDHQSGTERICEVVSALNYHDDDIIVNLQGDEPFAPASFLQQVAELLQKHPDANMSSIYTSLKHKEDVFNPNIVKIALDKNQQALYFSRAPIPWLRGVFDRSTASDFDLSIFHHHIGIYGYRASFIKQYNELPVSPLESLEALEQLRVLWNGYKIILTAAHEAPGFEINTPEDLEKARAFYQKKG